MSRLLDFLVPSEALRWRSLTREPLLWHVDRLRYNAATTERIIAAFERMVPLLADLDLDDP